MAVIKEWHCNGCGFDFDSDIPVCGKCGAVDPHVVRAFRSPFAFKGDKTKQLDMSLESFTKHYGLSDFSNNQSTSHEKKYIGLNGQPISLNDTWMDNSKGVVSSEPDKGESQGALIENLMKTAGEGVTTKKIVVNPGDRAATA